MSKKWIRALERQPVCAALLSRVFSLRPVSTEERRVLDLLEGNGKTRKQNRRELIYSRLRYRMTPAEHFLFRFDQRTPAEKAEYISHAERLEMKKRMNTAETRRILMDKYASYEAFRPLYKREAVRVSGPEQEETFRSFLTAHGQAVIKPLNAAKGHGVRLLEYSREESLTALFQEALTEAPFILEEPIRQDARMARFHPASVNTARLATWLEKDGTVKVAYASVRMGVGSSFVDNVGSGGIVAAVDEKTGKVISPAYRESVPETFEKHPDTGEPILGAQLPDWPQLLETAARAARMLPNAPWIGWDFALSTDGWVIVEANISPSFVGPQRTRNCGLRTRMRETIGAENMV